MYEWIGKLTQDSERLRQWSNYAAKMPQFMIQILCWIASYLIYVSAHSLRKTVYNNMKDLLEFSSRRTIHKVCRQYFHNLIIILYELLLDSHQLERNYSSRFQVIGEDHLEAALQQGRGAIIFLPHRGNFFYYYYYLSKKYNCLTIGTAGSSELSPIYSRFEQMGCKGLDYDSTHPLQMMRKLREHLNDNGVLFLMGDFWRNSFPKSTMFGRATRSPSGTAVLGIGQKTPIIPFCGKRIYFNKHLLFFSPPIHLSERYTLDNRRAATEELNGYLEKFIRDVPEQWFYWFNAAERWEQQ